MSTQDDQFQAIVKRVEGQEAVVQLTRDYTQAKHKVWGKNHEEKIVPHTNKAILDEESNESSLSSDDTNSSPRDTVLDKLPSNLSPRNSEIENTWNDTSSEELSISASPPETNDILWKTNNLLNTVIDKNIGNQTIIENNKSDTMVNSNNSSAKEKLISPSAFAKIKNLNVNNSNALSYWIKYGALATKKVSIPITKNQNEQPTDTISPKQNGGTVFN